MINSVKTSLIEIPRHTATPKIEFDNSEVKFEDSCSSSLSSNTKVSSNDLGKTPSVNPITSSKKIKMTNTFIGNRKMTGKKSLRIRKSKIRQPNTTKEYMHSKHTSYLLANSYIDMYSRHGTYAIQAVSWSIGNKYSF